jgi:outer membrane protein TolC
MYGIKKQLFSILYFMPLVVVAQIGPPSLEEMVQAAVKKDFKLANQKADIEINKIDEKKLKEAFLPRITLGAQDSYNISSISLYSPGLSIPDLNINIVEGNNTFTTRSNLLKSDISISALLFSGGKITYLKKALTEKQKALSLMMESNKQDIISEVISAYDQLALLRQVQLVLEESRKRLDIDKKIADKALRYGLITKYEHQKIEVAQAQLASRRIDYEGRLDVVVELLWLLTDIDRERILQLQQNMVPLETEDGQLNISKRSEIQAFDAVIKASEYKIAAEKTWIIPKVQALSSIGYLRSTLGHIKSSDPVVSGGAPLSENLPGFHIFPLFTVGIGLKWEIFNGNEGRREIEKAKLEVTKAQNEKYDITEKLELNLAQCRNNYSTSLSKVKLSSVQQQTASNALTQATAEYSTGLIKSSQLIEAEEDLQNASLHYLEAVFNQRRAAVSLLKAQGILYVDSITQ